MAQASGLLSITNHHQPLLLKPMDLDTNLLQSPIHKGTREYIDKKFTEMEQRMEQKLSVMRTAQSSIKSLIAQADNKYHADLNYFADEVAGIGSQLANLEIAFAASAAKPIEPPPPVGQRAHSDPEIRAFINTYGHKIPPRNRFSSYQYAEDLAVFVTLRPADMVVTRGETKWNMNVSSSMSHWVRFGGLGTYRGECPFERTGKKDYRIKEGWVWPHQAF